MQLFSRHTDGILLQLPNATGGDLDTTATISSDGETLVVTVANLNAVGWFAYEVALQLNGWKGTKAGTTVTLEAEGYGETDMFNRSAGSAAVAGGATQLRIPPFSVVQATFAA